MLFATPCKIKIACIFIYILTLQTAKSFKRFVCAYEYYNLLFQRNSLYATFASNIMQVSVLRKTSYRYNDQRYGTVTCVKRDLQ
jgi:hypothetical protein